MKFKIAIMALLPALALIAPQAHASQIVVNLDDLFALSQSFYTTDQGPGASFSASYGATPKIANTTGDFDYQFEFSGAANGVGNASFSTVLLHGTEISAIRVNNVSYSYLSSGSALTIAPFMVLANHPNIIEVIGNLGSARSLTFSGTVTFDASAVPEPASWATFLVGFCFMGLALRRKSQAKPKRV